MLRFTYPFDSLQTRCYIPGDDIAAVLGLLLDFCNFVSHVGFKHGQALTE